MINSAQHDVITPLSVCVCDGVSSHTSLHSLTVKSSESQYHSAFSSTCIHAFTVSTRPDPDGGADTASVKNSHNMIFSAYRSALLRYKHKQQVDSLTGSLSIIGFYY